MSAREIAVQRGFEPAETVSELVDAIRQDTAGIGACLSSIAFIASAGGNVPESVLKWAERAGFHAERIEAKCALALSAAAAAVPNEAEQT